MIFEALNLGSYYSNCYIVACDDTKEAAIIDPGGNFTKIEQKINELGLNLKAIILTHAHPDHIGAVGDLVKKYGAKVYIHRDDVEMLQEASRAFAGMFGKSIPVVKHDVELKHGDIIKIGDLNLDIIHTPGHSRGGICVKVENIMFTGDTLFNRSIGRTDFPGGSFEVIIDSIKNKIFKYDDETILYPGHNSPSTIRSEKLGNPFVN